MTCTQLRTKTRTSISRKICYIRSRFQILYAVEQFSSLFSKDKLKARGTHITNSWSAFPAHVVVELPYSSQPTAPTCFVCSWHLKHSRTGVLVYPPWGFAWQGYCTPALLSIMMSFGHYTGRCTTGSVAGAAWKKKKQQQKKKMRVFRQSRSGILPFWD